MHEGISGPETPHDLVHLIVEHETAKDGGFWGAVAAGAVFGSMEHIDGRRPPHSTQRSNRAIDERKDRLLRAELMASLVDRAAEHNLTDAQHVRAVARDVLSTLPDTSIDAESIIRAGRSLQEVSQRWSMLEVGDELTVEWPEKRPQDSDVEAPIVQCARPGGPGPGSRPDGRERAGGVVSEPAGPA